MIFIERAEQLLEVSSDGLSVQGRVFYVPSHSFGVAGIRRFEEVAYLTPQALAQAQALQAQRGRPLSREELFAIAVEDEEGLLTDNFDNGVSLNTLNGLHYSQDREAIAHIPGFWTLNPQVQQALGRFLAQCLIGKSEASIMELASGNRVRTRWNIILNQLAQFAQLRNIHVTLTDFAKETIPQKDTRSLGRRWFGHMRRKVDTHMLNLLEPLPQDGQKVDALLVTQGFDSVWLPEDVFYVKWEGKWYQGLCRLRINPRNQNGKKVEAALRGRSGQKLHKSDYTANDGIFVEQMLQEVSRDEIPVEVLNAYDAYGSVGFWYPGGLIAKIEDAFDHLLAPDGVMVVGGEASTNGGYCGSGEFPNPFFNNEPSRIDIFAAMYHVLSNGALYKHDEWPLVKAVLEARGYDVSLMDLPDFVQSQTGTRLRHADEHRYNYILVIRKRQ